ncbi:MAG: DUF2807 domain-containing protein [Bacteroidales bacterium]|jgi:cytoskeletal protein CcmA (bactofilin family)|nr:DUF2807 domain-containing protein [Bacteroidales bacterium]
MKKITYILIATLLISASCTRHERIRPSGNLVTETYSNFGAAITGIHVSDEATLYVSEGDKDQLEITIDDNVLPHLNLEQIREDVYIDFDAISFLGKGANITIRATVRDLKKLALSGASQGYLDSMQCDELRIDVAGSSNLEGDVYAQTCVIDLSGSSVFSGIIDANSVEAEVKGSSEFDGKVYADKYSVRLSGSSEYSGAIFANSVKVKQSGSSEMEVEGECGELDLDLEDASRFLDYEMSCDDLNAKLSGASHVRCTVFETLRCRLSGASTLRYDGYPRLVEHDLSGSSDLKPR